MYMPISGGCNAFSRRLNAALLDLHQLEAGPSWLNSVCGARPVEEDARLNGTVLACRLYAHEK